MVFGYGGAASYVRSEPCLKGGVLNRRGGRIDVIET